MLVLTLSRELILSFVFPGATAPFRPDATLIGKPIAQAQPLLDADPGLPEACRQILQGATISPLEIALTPNETYRRSIAPRLGDDGQAAEITVIYEPGDLAPYAELARMRVRLAQAMEAQFDAIAYFDADDRLTMCNATYANMHPGPDGPLTAGMSFEEILRRNLCHGGIDLPQGQQEAWLTQRLAERKIPYLTRELRQKDGRWFRLIDRQTLTGGRMNVLMDITDLKALEERFHNVITGTNIGTWSIDVETWIADYDDRAAAMLGYDKSELSLLTPADWRAMVHPDDLGPVEAHTAACLSGETDGYHAEYRMRHRDGSWVWLQSRGGLSSRHPDGRPKTFSGIQIDITRQKATEADLGLYAAAIKAASDGVTITDADGMILAANPAAAHMLGYRDPCVLIGRIWTDFLTPNAVATIRHHVRETLYPKGTWLGPANALRADGSLLEQELSLTKMPDGRIVCISRDVGARNAIERDRLDLRETVNRAHRQEIVNLLAAGLTHDLSNLVTLISHLSDPMLKGFTQDKPAVMEEIHGAARQMVALLEPIRHLGRRQPKRESTDLGALLTEAAGILHLGAPNDLAVLTHVPKDPITAKVDPMELMQVLLNLGLNARDALGHGPQQIDLILNLAHALPPEAKLETGVVPDAPFALFSISDTGPGIPPNVRARIWEPFFTTKKLRGTGLGLFVVADIVRAAGGAIALTTEQGKGTTFFIAWPLSARPLPPANE